MFSQLGDKLQEIFKDLRGHGSISETNINDALRQVRLALLEADVDFQVAKSFIGRVKEKALGEEVLRSVTPGQQIVKIFHDELSALLGGDAAPLNLEKPARILMVGLNGGRRSRSSSERRLPSGTTRRSSRRWINSGGAALESWDHRRRVARS
ncbi:MAG: signal recognition particle receptor subunit alpha, partial [Chthoniobacterales bacterium]